MKAGRQTNQRKAASVIAPGTKATQGWVSFMKVLKRSRNNQRVHPRGKSARGRRF